MKRKAQAAIAEADKLAAEVKGLRESVPTAEKIQSLIGIAIKNQAAQATAEAEEAKAAEAGPVARGADRTRARAARPRPWSIPCARSRSGPVPEVQAMLDGERKARERLERELADQRKASAEAKRLQEETVKSEQKRITIENLAGALCEGPSRAFPRPRPSSWRGP